VSRNQNPFGDFDMSRMFDPAKLFDPTKLMAEFKMPGVNMEQVVASQRRNLEALTAANQLAVQGMQAVTKRQAEILKQTLEQTALAMREVMGAGSPEDKAARQTDLAKEAFERAIANMRELAEMVAKAQNEANEVITKRVTESLDEMKDLLAKKRA
jgi:phasin family protein